MHLCESFAGLKCEVLIKSVKNGLKGAPFLGPYDFGFQNNLQLSNFFTQSLKNDGTGRLITFLLDLKVL